jgi:hypothetical protein
VPPPVAVRLIFVSEHVRTLAFAAFEMFADGATIVCVMVIVAVEVQPFVPVVVTV